MAVLKVGNPRSRSDPPSLADDDEPGTRRAWLNWIEDYARHVKMEE